MFKNACVLALEYGKDAPTTSSIKHAARASSCVKDTDVKMFIGKYIKSLCVISSRYAKFTFLLQNNHLGGPCRALWDPGPLWAFQTPVGP